MNSLRLLIVSEDPFIRSYLVGAANTAGFFDRVVGVDDGYSGLAEVWESVAQAAPISVVVIDRHSVGATADRLIWELRSDPRTQSTFLAALAPDDTGDEQGLNMICVGDPLAADMGRMYAEIARYANFSVGKAPMRATFRGN